MTITVNTREYLNSHGREPGRRLKGEAGGPGLWVFEVAYTGHDGTGYRPMTARFQVRDRYRHALATAKRRVRQELRTTDATLTVLP